MWRRVLSSLCLAGALCACSGDESDPPPPASPEEVYSGGLDGTVFDFTNGAFSYPLPLLDRDEERDFFKGRALFRDRWVVAPASTQSRDGLGPVFNARSCVDCHEADGRGAPPAEGEPMRQMLMRLAMGEPDAHGELAGDPTYGDQLQPFGAPGVEGEGEIIAHYEEVAGSYGDGEPFSLRKPSYDLGALAYGPLAAGVAASPRVARQIIGLGLLEAIPDADIEEALGRPARVWDRTSESEAYGRMGWKATQPSVRQQTGKAFQSDMGLTNELFPEPSCGDEPTCLDAPSGGEPEIESLLLDNVVFYARTLAVPGRRDADDPEVLRGRQLFRDLGCSSCHRPSHVTGEHPEVAGLAGQTIWPYTDLALHDLGEGLAAPGPDHRATATEWRTPPLWGVGLLETVNGHTFLLHDGRARGFAEAILWHGGEAEGPREGFRNLPRDDRDALIRFLGSL
jgi:CxxC motif-containing protein (DUF1111 family)